MDSREAKLALARKKLKDHQEKKNVAVKDEIFVDLKNIADNQQPENNNEQVELSYSSANDKNIDSGPSQPVSDKIEISSRNDLNVTEILISNKRSLEMQVAELQSKLSFLENELTSLNNINLLYKQQASNLEEQLKNINDKYTKTSKEVETNDVIIRDLRVAKSALQDENNNLQEQLEFTKSLLKGKETENKSLQNQLSNLQNQLGSTQLQLQQLISGSQLNLPQGNNSNDLENALQKNNVLEQQLKALMKEKDQLSMHYEHYVSELNEQLKTVVKKNQDLSNETQNLSIREQNLIEQLSDLEIRLQNYQKQISSLTTVRTDNNISKDEASDLQEKYDNIQQEFQQLTIKFNDLQTKYNEEKLARQSSEDENKTNHLQHIDDNISLSKLNADILSDKVAVQRATEQNKKLKIDLQELEEAFVKISKDKLELTEKLGAEKYLNRELTIKLADIDERAKDLQTKLIAKDEEMIRLQSAYREIKAQLENITNNQLNKAVESDISINNIQATEDSSNVPPPEDESKPQLKCEHVHLLNENTRLDGTGMPTNDAMNKLQERFLKIMDEVADLSDEKHRLEHIILQLQNETDTICEYVALYQQQRSLLKARDEERSAQIKIYQSECEMLRNKLEELSNILNRLSNDKNLSTYFQNDSEIEDLSKVMLLLTDVKNSSIIDPNRKCSELKDFYPCNCCSGKLIDV